MKSKADKKVNRVAKQLNKSLKRDVFGDRFWVRQIKKIKTNDVNYYLYELCDRLQPERNRIIPWETDFALTTFCHLAIEMNNFIIESDFWKRYNNKIV